MSDNDDNPMKNQAVLYQNDFGSSFHTLALTPCVTAIAAQKIIDDIFILLLSYLLVAFL